ncbi:MAG: hypothetical protein FJX74_05495 [Armatimonadetes bacterium]|nr:hypothetical protein [Armatimonadota bacterium]
MPDPLGAVLVVGDRRAQLDALVWALRKQATEPQAVEGTRGLREKFAQGTAYDLIILDSGRLETEADVAWLTTHHPHIPLVICFDQDEPTWCGRLPKRALVLPLIPVASGGAWKQVRALQLCAVLLAFSWDWAHLVSSVCRRARSGQLVLAPVNQDGQLLAGCQRAASAQPAALEETAVRYISRPDVAALVVAAGWTEKDQVLLFGDALADGPARIPAESLARALSGIPEEAQVLYLAAQAAFVGAAGLWFHRRIEGCPLDFCLDKLDVARGLHEGKLCEQCDRALKQAVADARCRLTPLQIEAAKRLLKEAADLCARRPAPPLVRVRGRELRAFVSGDAVAQMPLRAGLANVADSVKRHQDEYSGRERVLPAVGSYFLPARHYNSDSPVIPGPRHFAKRANITLPPQYMGGGYFLIHAGYGIAIDPGYDFLRLLYALPQPAKPSNPESDVSVGFTTEDIDLVIVTHDHLDHCADFETILRTRRGRRLYVHCTDAVATAHSLIERVSYSDIVRLGTAGDRIQLPTGMARALEIRRLPTLHWQHTYGLPLVPANCGMRMKAHLEGFGLHITLLPRGGGLASILITGDTLCPAVEQGAITPESFEPYLKPKHWSRLLLRQGDLRTIRPLVERAYQHFVETYLGLEADLACVHIGTVERKGWKPDIPVPLHDPIEGEGWKPDGSEPLYDGHHLGLGGCARVLQLLREPPKAVLMTEFGEELVGHRRHLCEALGKLWVPRGGAVPILPADVGLCIDLQLPHLNAQCSRCDEVHPLADIEAVEEDSDVLAYASKHSLMTGSCQWR